MWSLKLFNSFTKHLSSPFIPKPNKWLQFLHFKKICLKLIHKNARIRWCKFGANTQYILSKLKVVISKNKFYNLHEHISLYLFVLITIKHIFKSLKVSIMWYTNIPHLLRPRENREFIYIIFQSWGIINSLACSTSFVHYYSFSLHMNQIFDVNVTKWRQIV